MMRIRGPSGFTTKTVDCSLPCRNFWDLTLSRTAVWTLDRQYMAGRIFSDRCLLEKVEALVFPEVIADFRTWKERVADAPFAIMESAIYLEKPALAGVADKVLTVLCPEDVRIGRVMARSGMSREQVLARMANQWSDERRTAASDYVIVSDFRNPLLPQVESVYIDMKDNS